jgi:hypothetical protein
MKKFYPPIIISSLLFCGGELFSQNVGINNDGSTPEAGVMLDVKGTAAKTATGTETMFQLKSFNTSTNELKMRLILHMDVAGVTSRYGQIDVADYTGGTPTYVNLVLQPSGGNVGIGTSSAAAMLDVKGSGSTLATFGLGVRNSSNTYALAVRDDGYVGIGTITPTEQLEVVAASGTGGIMITANPDAHIDSRSLTTGKNFDLIGSYMGWDQNAIYIGGYNSFNSGRSANKVYCGTSGADLDLYAKNIFANGDIQLVNNLNYAPTGGGVHNGVPWDALRDDGSNNVLWIVPWNGQYSSVQVGNDGTGIGGPPVDLVDVHGDVRTNDFGASLNALWAASDLRYKKDIAPMKDVLPDVMKLQGVKFNWRKDEFPDLSFFNDRRQIGFIAQEMEKIFPEIVETNKGGYKSIQYAKLTAVLAEAIKEQQQMIDNLKTTSDKQQTEILNLKSEYDARLKALEQIIGTKAEK